VSYTFNGLGEYYMVYAPDVFTLQARTTNAIGEDGTTSDATVFSAFVAQEHQSNSGVVSLYWNYGKVYLEFGFTAMIVENFCLWKT